MDQEDEIIQAVTVQIDDQSFPWFVRSPFLALVMHILFEGPKMQDTRKLLRFGIEGEEFEKVPATVQAI